MPTRSLVGPRRVVIAAGAALVAGACGSAAAAAPPTTPAIAQYIEQIPTAAGAHPAGAGRAAARVPEATQRAIEQEAGASAPLLEHVVSSEAYGAPTTFSSSHARGQKSPAPARRTTKPPAATRGEDRDSTPAAAERAALPPAPSAASAASGTVGGRALVLALALGAAMAVAVLVRLARR